VRGRTTALRLHKSHGPLAERGALRAATDGAPERGAETGDHPPSASPFAGAQKARRNELMNTAASADAERLGGSSLSTGRKLRILFLCTGNSCRSQMAEGWARRLKSDCIEAYSAGVEPKGLDPRAVAVMKEAGVDISSQRSKSVEELKELDLDYVITLCGRAAETCPRVPGKAKVLHKGFEDPPRLAASAADEEEALGHYRRVRDQIRAFVEALPGSLKQLESERKGR